MHNCFSEKVVSTIDCFSQESLARLKETLGGTRDSTGVVTVNSQVAAKAFILLNCRGYQSFCLKHNDIITLTLTQDTAPISD